MEDFFDRTPREDLKKEWPEEMIDTLRQAISPATIDAQGTGRIGHWLIEERADQIWLTDTWEASLESDWRFRFFVIVEKSGGAWKVLRHGREEFWRKK